MIRAALASLLVPTWGIYSGYELCENVPVHEGSEEYRDSEKFELKPRNWNAPGHLRDFITRLNAARNDNAAFRRLRKIEFIEIKNEQMIAWTRFDDARQNVMIMVATLDPYKPQDGWLRLPLGV